MPDPYILEPLDTDANSIYSDFVEYVQGAFPDWTPSEAQLDIIIARFFSQQVATVADMASRVQRSIYRYMGANLMNIPPLPGSAATATIAFHVIDPSIEYTLPIGTEVGLRDANGDLMVFETLQDMVSPVGAIEWPSVVAQATELGESGNNLGGPVEMLQLFDWIDAAQVDGVSSGGSDPEEDDVYLNRLTENLMIPRRPQLANDLVIMAHNVPGVWRAAAIDNYRDTGGGTYATDLEDSVAISATDKDGIAVAGDVLTNLMTYLQENLRQNFLLTFVPPTYHTIAVTYQAHGYQFPGADHESMESSINTNLHNALLPQKFGQFRDETLDRSWKVTPVLRYLELTTIVESTAQIDWLETLTFSVDGGAASSANKNLSGAFPLTQPGAIDGVVLIP